MGSDEVEESSNDDELATRRLWRVQKNDWQDLCLCECRVKTGCRNKHCRQSCQNIRKENNKLGIFDPEKRYCQPTTIVENLVQNCNDDNGNARTWISNNICPERVLTSIESDISSSDHKILYQ